MSYIYGCMYTGRGNSPPERKDRTPPQGRGKPRDLGGSGDADGQEHLTVTDSYYSSEEERGMEEGRDRRPGRERRRKLHDQYFKLTHSMSS